MFPELFEPERRLLERLHGVMRLDSDVYGEIARDTHGIPQAFAVVISASALAGLGQSTLPLAFLWMALAILQWVAVSGLIWCGALFVVKDDVDYGRLLRCTGFAYAWFALQVGYSLPFIGWILAWASSVLFLVSLVLATREVFGISSGLAALICLVSLVVPALFVGGLAG